MTAEPDAQPGTNEKYHPENPGSSFNTLRNGSGAPSIGLGNDGDFYIDTSADTIYGPKTAGSWGSPTSIVGPAGTNGADGKTVLNGTGVPSGGTGSNGDFYIDTTSGYVMYGPKSGGLWGSGTNLVGTPGTNGNSVLHGIGAPSGGTGVNGDFYIDTAATAIYGPKAGGVWGSPTSLIGTGSTSGAQAVRTSDQSLSAGAVTALSWDAESYDDAAYHDNGANPSRLTIPAGLGGAGTRFRVEGHVDVTVTNTALRAQFYIRKNGTTRLVNLAYGFPTTATTEAAGEASWVDEAPADGDYYEIVADLPGANATTLNHAMDVNSASWARITKLK